MQGHTPPTHYLYSSEHILQLFWPFRRFYFPNMHKIPSSVTRLGVIVLFDFTDENILKTVHTVSEGRKVIKEKGFFGISYFMSLIKN